MAREVAVQYTETRSAVRPGGSCLNIPNWNNRDVGSVGEHYGKPKC
jgi:hypothetical protein